MVKKLEPLIPKDRISIVISKEDRKHLGFIALERDLSSASDAISYVLSHFDRSGRLKKGKEMNPESSADIGDVPGGIRVL